VGFMEGSHPDTRPRVARTVTLSIEYALAGGSRPGAPGASWHGERDWATHGGVFRR